MSDHSPEAVAAYPSAPFTEPFTEQQIIERERAAFDAGRASRLVADRETAAGVIELAMDDYEANGFVLSKSEFASLAADAIFSSGVLLSRAVVEAEVREAIYADVRAMPSWGNEVADGFDVGMRPKAEVLRVIRNEPEAPPVSRAARIRKEDGQ